jgi:hypothetical protein
VTARAAAVLAALALAGCALRRAPQPSTTEGEWAHQRNAATRRAYLYDGLKHRATATVTLLSLDVREARARRLAQWFGWTSAELDDRLAQERLDAEQGEELFLSFYAADRGDDDLDAPKSVWRVVARAEGADLVATRVTSVERDATVLGLFPYVGPFDTMYRVFVPRAPDGPLAGRPFVFEIASARGKLTMDFATPIGVVTPQEPAAPP